ncbi:hypothetical protein J7E99_30030 [Streptomyces sp. ISL-44]|uniref:DUF6415 family natural product biosynthesis protein n=1 Tax=Streptomyces sp. ISL-44 TaxID=2819184 RepID=UPI001BE7E04C|nr:DUF6415 family natural product biosynthesis protein [Streptomyces sp. ISL-44]MBT2544833.1 hypothetical protein [Streptomyces sp. ISL-44]
MTSPAPQAPEVADSVRALCARVLTPNTYRIPGSEVRETTNLLCGHVRLLLREPGDGTQARTDAELLLSHGPGEGRLGAWIHMRALARVCRVLLTERQMRRKRGSEAGHAQHGTNVVAAQ